MKTSRSIPVAILSSDRKTESLGQTVRSLKNAGFYDIYIYYDHDRSGVWPGYQKIIRNVLHMFGTRQPVLIVEDDIVVCRDLHQYIGDELVDKITNGIGLISLYLSEWTRKQLFAGSSKRLLESKDDQHICGALAWLWNPHVLLKLTVADDIERDTLLGTDIHVPKWLAKHGYRMLHHQPSLVEHADCLCSTYEGINDMIYRHSDSFIGEQTNVIEYLNDEDIL